MPHTDVLLVIDRTDHSRSPGAVSVSQDARGSVVRVALGAAAEAQSRAVHSLAYTHLLGGTAVPARAKALVIALGDVEVGGAPLRERLRYQGVDLWQFVIFPLYGPVCDLIEVVDMCHDLIGRYRPRAIELRGVGDPSDSRWRYVLEALAAREQIPFAASGDRRPRFPTAHPVAAPALRWPRLMVGFAEAAIRPLGIWLSRLAILRCPDPPSGSPFLAVVSWSREWTRLPDPVTGVGRWADEQFDAVVRAAAIRGFPRAVGLDVYGGYRRHGSSGALALARDFSEGLRGLGQRLFSRAPIAWRTFHAYLSLASRRGVHDHHRHFARLAGEVIGAAPFDTMLSHREIPLLPPLRNVVMKALGLHAVECALALDAARDFFSRVRPAAILVTNHDHHAVRALLAEAARAGVPSIGLQDGAYPEWGCDFPYPEASSRVFGDVRKSIIPRVTCVWGPAVKRTLQRQGGYSESAVAVTGNWRYDAVLAAKLTLSRERLCARLGVDPKRRIVALATPDLPEAPRLAAWVTGALRNRPDYQLILKPHPGQAPGIFARVLREHGSGRERLITGRLPEILLACDVVITEASTVAVEAALLDKPVIETFICTTQRRGFVEAGIAAAMPADGDLLGTMDGVLTDPAVQARLTAARQAYVSDQLLSADGRAAERVVDVIEHLVRASPASDESGPHSSSRATSVAPA